MQEQQTSDRGLVLRSDSEESTEAIGFALGRSLPAGAVVGLVGPLGCGKTCLVRGIAAGLGLERSEVCSPSFLYLVEYPEGRLRLFHADLYRLADAPGEQAESAFESIGLYAAIADSGVTVVEWWDCYRGTAPEPLLRIEFTVGNVNHRSLKLSFSGAGLDGSFAALAALAH